jgi:hypothetical protein
MDDLVGWQDTRWGMTEQDLIAVIGESRLCRTPKQDYKDCYSEFVIPVVDMSKGLVRKIGQ